MSLPPVSPRAVRRKSISLLEQRVNRDFDDNMTLPVTNRDRSKGKRGVSFGGESITANWENLSAAQQRRRKMQPRKSILKMLGNDESLDSVPTESSSTMFAETVDFSAMYAHMDPLSSNRAPRTSMPAAASGDRPSLGPRRRVSFAPSAHVRMFENKEKEKKPRRKSSMGMGALVAAAAAASSASAGTSTSTTSPSRNRQSLSGSSRRSSIQIPAPPQSPARYFVGEGEGEGEASMEIESDSDFSEDSADYDEGAVEASAVQHPETTQLDDEDNGSYATDSDGEMDMEETEVMDAIPQHYSETDTGEQDMSIESSTSVVEDDDEKTMDFTVALGGPMPRVAPSGAIRGRASIGYSNPYAPGESLPAALLPGDGEESEMEETVAYGGVYVEESISSGEDTNSSGNHEAHTATYNFHTSRSGMDFTTAIGGINHAEETAMDLTTVGGGIHDQSGMDFTVAGGGIYGDGNANDRTEGMDFTTAVGGVNAVVTATFTTTTNIFAQPEPTENTANLFAPQTSSRPSSANIFAAPPTNIFVQDRTDYLGTTGLSYPVLSPLKSDSASAPARMSKGESGSPQKGDFSTTPAAKATPKSTPRKSTTATPSFARATTSSTQKHNHKPEPSTKKKNPFAPSPDTPGLQRSKNRTPRKSDVGMDAAASVAKRLSFAPSASTAAPLATNLNSSATAAPLSATSSPRKRSREEDDDEDAIAPSPAKRPRNIFAPVFQAQATQEPPVQSLGANVVGEEEEEEMEIEDDIAPESEPNEEMEINEPEPRSEEEEEPQEATPEPPLPSPDPERPLPAFTGTPSRMRKSLGPASRSSMTPNKALKSPARRQSYFPPPREAESEEDEQAHDPTTIKLAEFLSMTGVEFLDDLAAVPRRSSVGYGLLGSEDREYAAADFAEANAEAIFVNMFNWAIEKMKADIAAGQEELDTTEKICNEENPVVVREYLAATEEDRGLFEMTLREFKAITQLRARGQWYDWKLSIMGKIEPDVREIRDEMAADAERHAQESETANTLLPDLRRRHEELKAELARHRAAVVEIEKCDQDELRELKAAVVEQDVEIERFTAERDDKASTVATLQSKADKLDAEINSHRAAIDRARAECDESTPTDVLRLESELSSIQDLHGWVVQRASPATILFADELLLSVPLVNDKPDVVNCELSLVKESSGPNNGLLNLTRAALNARPTPSTLPGLVRAVGQMWTAARHVRDELNLVKLYYPLAFRSTGHSLVVTTALMLPSVRARVRLSFAVEAATLLQWPAAGAVADLNVRVETVYGKTDATILATAARETLATAVPDMPGILVAACTSVIDAAA